MHQELIPTLTDIINYCLNGQKKYQIILFLVQQFFRPNVGDILLKSGQ